MSIVVNLEAGIESAKVTDDTITANLVEPDNQCAADLVLATLRSDPRAAFPIVAFP